MLQSLAFGTKSCTQTFDIFDKTPRKTAHCRASTKRGGRCQKELSREQTQENNKVKAPNQNTMHTMLS